MINSLRYFTYSCRVRYFIAIALLGQIQVCRTLIKKLGASVGEGSERPTYNSQIGMPLFLLEQIKGEMVLLPVWRIHPRVCTI